MHEIIGMEEYEKLMEPLLEFNVSLRGLKKHEYHPFFIELLLNQINIDTHLIWLDRLMSFEEFPEEKGIYFCCRRISLDAPLSEVWYVGKARNFRRRWKRHHKLMPLKAIKNIAIICLPFDPRLNEDIAFYERVYINALEPSFNDTSEPESYLRCVS